MYYAGWLSARHSGTRIRQYIIFLSWLSFVGSDKSGGLWDSRLLVSGYISFVELQFYVFLWYVECPTNQSTSRVPCDVEVEGECRTRSLECHVCVYAHCALLVADLSSSALLSFGRKPHKQLYMVAELG